MRLIVFSLFTLLLLGCRNEAQSQQFEERPPQRVEQPDTGDLLLEEEIRRSRQTAITRAVQAVAPAVVSINVIEIQRVRVRDPYADFFSDPWFDQFFGRRERIRDLQVQGLGSGFIISSDGYIVTNDHVAGRATRITVSLYDGTTMEARLVGTDPATDIALLKVEPTEPLPYLAFSEDDEVLVGEWVIALGNPFGFFEAAEPTVTVGVVSAARRDLQGNQEGRIYRDMIQTDAAINKGNSGGPLVNAVGEVIGVNTAIVSRTGGSVGLGFAVPASRARRIIEELRENGSIDRSYYTGLYVRGVTERIAVGLGLPRAAGAFVHDVDPSSPAADAGLRPYDVIVAIEGRAVTNVNDYVARVYDFRPGDVVTVEIIRSGQARSLRMRIGRQEG